MKLAAAASLLVACAHALGAQSSAAGRLEGTVFDSVRAGPYAGALVRAARIGVAPETTFAAVVDGRGSYRIDRLPPGSYAVSVTSPLLDSLEYGRPAVRTTVAASRTTRLELGTPSRATLQSLACPGLSLPEGTGALVGTITALDTDRPLGGAQVAVAWSELAIDTVAQQVSSGQRAARDTTDGDGQYRMCGVPMGDWLVLQVQHDGRAGAVVRTSIGPAGVAVRNLSFSARGARPLEDTTTAAGDGPAPALPAGDAVLVGSVSDERAHPIAEAQVTVLGTAGAARSDASGQFRLARLPAGTLELEVRQIGYAAVRRVVELRAGGTTRADVRLERTIALDSIRVVARRLKYPEFDTQRRFSMYGRFLDEDEIARRPAANVSDLVYTLNGFWVVGNGPGAAVVSARTSTLGGACAVNVVIDRMQHQRINDVPLSQVGAIEAYPRGGEPPQYRSPCGVIMIWTKR